MKKYILKYWILISVLAVVVVTEATLRLALGQGLPVLSQADSDTGYRFQPNQKIYRFGKNIDFKTIYNYQQKPRDGKCTYELTYLLSHCTDERHNKRPRVKHYRPIPL